MEVSQQNNITIIPKINIFNKENLNIKNLEIQKNLPNKYVGINKNLKHKLDPSTFSQIENCLKEKKIELSEIKKELSGIKFLHNPNDYPIYPNDLDDPEGFYANI